ncbi:MAG: hypothetical protein FJ298_00150 [Planctomycetes bacterium]|nr:hypothetical protein [Planctomycetota bacterium]
MRTLFLPLLLALVAFLLAASLAASGPAPQSASQSASTPRSGFLGVLEPGTKLSLELDGDGLVTLTLFPGLGTHEVLEVGPDWFSCSFGANVQGLPVTRIPQTAIRSIQIYPQPPK